MATTDRRRRSANGRPRRAPNPRPHLPTSDPDHLADEGGGTTSDQSRIDAASGALRDLASKHAPGCAHLVGHAFFGFDDRDQQAAFDDQFAHVVTYLIRRGWCPNDLYYGARRTARGAEVEFLMCVVARQSVGRGVVHPQWRAQLDSLCTTVDGGARAWAMRNDVDWPAGCDVLLDLLARLRMFPSLARVLPMPGTAEARADADVSRIDERILRKVRGLLAKAESTEFEEEAAALSAKAQQLMTEHSIERAVAEQKGDGRSRPTLRRIWLEAPYLQAKAALVGAVAHSNQCQAVTTRGWGYVALVGHAPDLDATELLVTSLLVQAARTMTVAGPQMDWLGQSRTRAFRQSFLVAYAGRIGERLSAATQAAQEEADSAAHGDLLPILSSRAEEVRNTVNELFPHLESRPLRVSDRGGYQAGRAAADQARLDFREAIGTPRT